MNKLLKSIVCVATGLAMSIGAGVGVASREAKAAYAADSTITFDFEDEGAHRSSGSNSYSSNSYSENDIGISLSYADSVTSGTPLNGSANVTGRIAKNTTNSPSVKIGDFSFASGTTIKSITYYTKGVSAMQMVVAYSTDDSSYTTLQTLSSMPTSSTKENIDNLSISATSFYLKWTVSVSSSTGSNRDFQLDDIVVTYDNGGTPTPTTYTVTYNANGGKGNMSDANQYNDNDPVTVLDNEFTRYGYIFNSWNTQANGGGTSYDEGDSFNIKANTTLYAQWDVDPNPAGTQTNPYTVAQAKAAIDAGDGVTGVYVAGIISQVDSFNQNYNSITYWISDDGTTTDQFEVYSGKGLGNTAFASVNDISLGASVVVYGNIKLYSGTYEFDKNNYLVSYEHEGELNQPQPVYSEGVVTWDAIQNASGYAVSVDGGAAVNVATTSYNVGNFDTPSGHTVTVTAIGTGSYTNSAPGVVKFALLDKAGTQADPFDIANAKAAVDGNLDPVANAYVAGIICQVQTFVDNSITYWISDDGTTDNQLEVYKGKGLNNANFSSKDDLVVGASVVVKGNLTIYDSEYEFSAGSTLISYDVPKTLSSIAVDGDYQTSFEMGDEFNHNGATVIATYSDSTTNDVTSQADFSEPDMSTAGNKTITVTYTEGGVTKTTTYSIFVSNPNSIVVELDYAKMVAGGITTSGGAQKFEEDDLVITITNGAANATDHDVRVYAGASITFTAPTDILSIEFTCSSSNPVGNFNDATGLDKENSVWTGSASSVTLSANKQVRITGLVITYTKPSSAQEVESKSTYAKLSYNYSKGASAGVIDGLKRSLLGEAGSEQYADWSNITDNSGVVYAGNSNLQSNAIQLRTDKNNSGIVVTSNESGKVAKKVTIKWNTSSTSGRVLNVYGRTAQDGSYSSAADLYGEGEPFDTFTYDGENLIQTININGNYSYLGFRSNSNALFIDSILVQWGDVSFSYDDVAIRLGGRISKTLWGSLNDIQGYGVMLSTKTYVDNNGGSLKNLTPNNSDVKDFYMALSTKAPVEDGDYYYWNLYKSVTTSLTADYVAVAYIKTSSGTIYLQQTVASAKSLANGLINSEYELDIFEGSLADLALK